MQVSTRVDLIGQRAVAPKLLPYIQNPIFSCLDNNTLCILLSKLCHINAHPPLGARGAERGASPSGLLQLQPHAIAHKPESASIPTGNVELPTPASDNGILARLTNPPLAPFLLYPGMRTLRSNSSFLSAWHMKQGCILVGIVTSTLTPPALDWG